MSQLGDFVRERREAMDWSKADLAKACGLSPAYISQIESGVNPTTGRSFSPKVDTLRRLAKGLRAPYEQIDRLARGLPIDQADEDAKTAELVNLIRQVPPELQDAARRMLRGLVDEGMK